MSDECNITLLPTTLEMFSGMTTAQIVLFVLSSLTYLATLVLGIAQINYCIIHMSNKSTLRKMFVLIALIPALSLTALIRMVVPRAQGTLNQIAALIIMCAMYSVTSLGRSIYKTREEYSDQLFTKEVEIVLRTPPCCCCCCCLPRIKPTRSNLTRLERLVLQSIFVRLVAVTISCFMQYADRENHKYFDYLELACVPSLLLAMYGSHVLITVILTNLSGYKISPLFRIVDVSFGIYNGIYLLIFKQIVMRLTTFPCGPVLLPEENAKYISYFVLLIILFLLSLLATKISKSEGNLLFHKAESQASPMQSIEHSTSSEELPREEKLSSV